MTNAPFPIRQIAAERGLRVFKEECHADSPRSEQEWFLEIRGKGGILYGNDATSFWVDTSSGRAHRFAHIPCQKSTVADGEARFRFDASRIDAVLAALEPRKKRVLSDEHRKRLAEASAASRFRGSSST